MPSGNFTILASARYTADFVQVVGSWFDYRACAGEQRRTCGNHRSRCHQLNFRLGPVSTSRGTTARGKNDDVKKGHKMGSVSGREREEMREDVSALSAAPRMLTNSVSGALMSLLSMRRYYFKSMPVRNRRARR